MGQVSYWVVVWTKFEKIEKVSFRKDEEGTFHSCVYFEGNSIPLYKPSNLFKGAFNSLSFWRFSDCFCNLNALCLIQNGVPAFKREKYIYREKTKNFINIFVAQINTTKFSFGDFNRYIFSNNRNEKLFNLIPTLNKTFHRFFTRSHQFPFIQRQRMKDGDEEGRRE